MYSDERDFRKQIFKSTLERVKKGQLAFDRGERSYDVQINYFSDLTFEEFGTSFTGFGILGGDNADIDDSIVPETQRIISFRQPRQIDEYPESLDWTERGGYNF